MSTTALGRSYYPSLDGLRGIAILLVISCHNYGFLPYFGFGWIGVDLFFVLSGFLITDILLSTKNNKNFLQNFYIRRILRIFPVYYIVLLLYFLIVPLIPQLYEQYQYYYDHKAMTWFHLVNWLYILNERPNDTLLFGHFWSLSVEEQFYLLWPLLVMMCSNMRRLTRIIYIILATFIALRLLTWLYWGANYTTYTFQYMTRIDGLCVGSLIAIWRFSNIRALKTKFFRFAIFILGIHGIVFILSKSLLPGLPHFMVLGYTSISVIFGAIILMAIQKTKTIANSFLENKSLKFLGKISYGLYIIHWPVFMFFTLYIQDIVEKWPLNPMAMHIILSTVAFLVAVLISVLSYNLFEKKMLALKEVMTSEGFFYRLRQRLPIWMRPISIKQSH